jgi:hypothetical protein
MVLGMKEQQKETELVTLLIRNDVVDSCRLRRGVLSGSLPDPALVVLASKNSKWFHNTTDQHCQCERSMRHR